MAWLPPAQNISINLGEPFAAWQNLRLTGTPPVVPPPGSIRLLLKYLCDINPNVPASPSDQAALPTLHMITPQGGTDTYLTLAYRQYAGLSGVTVTLQTSPDLQNWTNVPTANLYSQQTGTDTNTGDAMMQLGVKVTGATHQFIRLNVTSQ